MGLRFQLFSPSPEINGRARSTPSTITGPIRPRHRPPPNQRVATAFPDFFLSQARTAERRIYVHSIGGNAIADFARVIVQKIRADDFSIIKSCVCKCAFSVAIP
jgi:hypothetical protein